MIELVVHNLNKRFGGLHALKDVNFEINGPELIGLIGPNGAGKTTLTNAIIEFLGYDPFPEPRTAGERLAAKRRRLGLSRKRLAKKLSMDEMTLARIENGEYEPSRCWPATLMEFVSAGSEDAQ